MNDQGDTSAMLVSPLRRGPAGRADAVELEAMVTDARNSPLFQAVLQWLDGFVVVLNGQRQILVADEAKAQRAGFEDIEQLVGARPGEAFGCVHADGGEDGCGTSRACAHCGVLQAILASQDTGEPVDAECTLTLKGDERPYTVRYRIRATRAHRDDLTLLVLHEEGDLAPPHPLAEPDLDDLDATSLPAITRVRLLGRGSSGQVFMVEDAQGRQLALKALRCDPVDGGICSARFRRESEVALALKHDNVVRTLAVDETDSGLLYMLTEYCPRGAVSRWLQRHGVPSTELLLHWMIGVTRGLDHLWRGHAVVHRDIKPDNLLLGLNGTIKIADFGIVRRTARREDRLTGKGMVVGTPHYMSPEQARGKPRLDCRADLYSMGATFFHLACGSPPVDGASPTEVLRAQLTAAPPPIRMFQRHIPGRVAECIYWLLNKAPRHRPPTPAALLEVLQDIAEALGVDPDSPPSPWTCRRMTPRRLGAAAAALVVLAIAAALLWRALQPAPPERPDHRPPKDEADPPVPIAFSFEDTTHPVALNPRTATTGAEVFGINEGVALPRTTMGSGQGGLLDHHVLTRRSTLVADLGATLVRAGSHTFPRLNWQDMAREGPADFTGADTFFAAIGEADLDVVAVIGPWPGARTSMFTRQYVPEDMGAYTDWVEAVVERYDGDGHLDAPNLVRPVRLWEVDNEPDLHHDLPPRAGQQAGRRQGAFETPQEYAEVLLATAAAIRRADPEAFVLSGGIYRPMAPKGRTYLEDVLAVPGVPEAVDAISLHCYLAAEQLDVIPITMQAARELAPDHPIWITETSVPSSGKGAWMSPDWQASMVVALHGALLAEGADRIFWHALVDPPRRQGPTGFRHNSLYRAVAQEGASRWERKPAGDVYERLTACLAGVDLTDMRGVTSGDGMLLQTADGWLAFSGTPTVPAEATQALDLLTGETAPVADVVTAPAWLTR